MRPRAPLSFCRPEILIKLQRVSNTTELRAFRTPLHPISKGQEKVIPTSYCSSSNAVHCSLAVRSCREVVDYLQVLNSKKFWEASDGVEEEALFEVLGGAIREKVQDGDGGILQKEL